MISSFFVDAVLGALLFLQATEPQTAEAMIKKLASGDFKERIAADAWLRQRPDTVPALEGAIGASDLEAKRRIAGILAFHELRKVRTLETAVTEGAVDDVIGLLSQWPSGKHEDAAQREFCRLTRAVIDLSRKQKGAEVPWYEVDEQEDRDVLTGRLISMVDFKKASFVRGRDVMWRVQKGKMLETNCTNMWMTASGSVEIDAKDGYTGISGAIYARGPIKIRAKQMDLVIVGSSDVAFDVLLNTIVIARGKVTCNDAIKCHIISGDTVRSKRLPVDCTIVENDTNPLGYIRWADAPKGKAAPKK